MSKFALQKAAQAWCTPETEKITMIPELAKAFADIIDELIDTKPKIIESSSGCKIDKPNNCAACAGSKFC